MMNVSARLIQSAKGIADKAPESVARIIRGETTINKVEGELKRQALRDKTEENKSELEETRIDVAKKNYTKSEQEEIDKSYPTLVEYSEELAEHAKTTDPEIYFDEIKEEVKDDYRATRQLEQPLTLNQMRYMRDLVAAYMRLDEYCQRVISVLILHPAITVSELSTRCNIRRDYLYRVMERILNNEPTLKPIVDMLKK
jgi:SMC interacting uncharacterized protein involved in chromosome segregation